MCRLPSYDSLMKPNPNQLPVTMNAAEALGKPWKPTTIMNSIPSPRSILVRATTNTAVHGKRLRAARLISPQGVRGLVTKWKV